MEKFGGEGGAGSGALWDRAAQPWWARLAFLWGVWTLVGLFFALRPNTPASESSTSGDATTSTTGSEKTIDVAVAGGTMTPSEITVNEGDRVNLRVTSDSPLELHLHGYDIEKDIEPNEPMEIPFDATITGRFEIEDHDTNATLGQLLVQPR